MYCSKVSRALQVFYLAPIPHLSIDTSANKSFNVGGKTVIAFSTKLNNANAVYALNFKGENWT